MAIENSKRTCGTCTMCCKLLAVPELKKPEGIWCDGCAIGVGCRIYNHKPQACTEFECLWLKGYGEDNERPDKTKIVITVQADGETLTFFEDRPGLTRKRYQERLEHVLTSGIPVLIICRQERVLIRPAFLGGV